MLPHSIVGILVAMMMLGAEMVSAQDYPNKPIRIVTSGVGGGGDFASRQIAQGISGSLGQPIIVDNRGGGVIPGQMVSQAAPDGYTLLVHGGTFWIGTLLRNAPYDPVTDFAPISMVSMSPNILVVHPSLPVKSVKALIALAKARPGALNYSSGEVGGGSNLAGYLFNAMAGVKIVIIPHTVHAAEITDLINGQVQLSFNSPDLVRPHIKSGRLRALAATSPEPSVLAPGLPTVAAAGLPGFESTSRSALFAPAKTPRTIINRLNQEIVRFLNTPEVKERFLKSGNEAVGSSPEDLAMLVKSNLTIMGKVIKDAGIKAD